jgi:hypothetical protein
MLGGVAVANERADRNAVRRLFDLWMALTSTMRAGSSTPSFIKSRSDVPPAT